MMEDITITLRLDPGYRAKVESAGINFENYLTGVVMEALLKNGKLNRLLDRVEHGSVSAKMALVNTEGLGCTMREVITEE